MIQQLLRPEVHGLISYSPSKEMNLDMVRLDGNESPYPLPLKLKEKIAESIFELELNRYPDKNFSLRSKISKHLKEGISPEQVLPGNGSDEVIQFLIQSFIQPGDKVLSLSPTFSMYRVFTELAGGIYNEIPLKDDGTVNQMALIKALRVYRPKMVFLCSPNNPTGTLIPSGFVREILAIYRGILVIDEAYGEFSDTSMLKLIKDFPNLVITRTFSKAFGLAGIRLGYLVGSKGLVDEVSRVVRPYHLNLLTQRVGEIILDNYSLIEERVKEIKNQRERLNVYLKGYPGWNVLPSEANFLFLYGPEVNELYNRLLAEKIKVRKFTYPGKNAIRITIGTPRENNRVCQVIQDFRGGMVRYGAV